MYIMVESRVAPEKQDTFACLVQPTELKEQPKEVVMKKCRTCRRELPEDQFPNSKHHADSKNSQCKRCWNLYQKEWQKRHLGRALIASKKSRDKERAAGEETYLEKRRLRQAERRRTHAGEDSTIHMRKYWADAEKHRLAARKKRAKIKREVLTHYSKGNIAACVVCGEGRIDCLSIDHIDNSGYMHRKTLGVSGYFLPLLRSQEFPAGYQTMCMNCQWVKKAKTQRELNEARDAALRTP